MGLIVNQSIRNGIISYSGIAIGFISTILLFPYILGAERFGLTRSMIAIMTISAQLVNLGIPNSIIKFFPSLSLKTDNPQGLYWLFILPPLAGLFIFTCVFISLDEYIQGLYSDSSILVEYYYLIIPMVISLSFFGVLNSFIKASFNTVFASFLQEVLLRIVVIINLILFYFDLINFDQFIFIFVINYFLQYTILFLYAVKKQYINFKPSMKPFNRSVRVEISKYSIFSFFSGFTMILVGNIDLIMVDIFEGLEKTGIYAIALYVGAVISIPRRSVSKITFPVISKAFEVNDLDEVQTIYNKSSLNQLLFGLLLYIIVVVNIDNLYSILPNTFAEGSIVIIIIGIANLFDIATGANGQIIISSSFYRFDFLSSFILMMISIILNLILIPKYGITGAALATASSIIAYNIIKMIFVWFKFKMQPFGKPTFTIIILGIVVFLFSGILPQLPNAYADISMRSFFIIISYMYSVWALNLSKEVNQTLEKLIKKVLG